MSGSDDLSDGFVALPPGSMKQIRKNLQKNRAKRGDVLVSAAWNHIQGSPSTQRKTTEQKDRKEEKPFIPAYLDIRPPRTIDGKINPAWTSWNNRKKRTKKKWRAYHKKYRETHPRRVVTKKIKAGVTEMDQVKCVGCGIEYARSDAEARGFKMLLGIGSTHCLCDKCQAIPEADT